METISRVNETYYTSESYDGDLTSVQVIHIPTGTFGVGHSRRNPEDVYDKKLGRQIAYFRAFERLSNKLVKAYVKNGAFNAYD